MYRMPRVVSQGIPSGLGLILRPKTTLSILSIKPSTENIVNSDTFTLTSASVFGAPTDSHRVESNLNDCRDLKIVSMLSVAARPKPGRARAELLGLPEEPPCIEKDPSTESKRSGRENS